MDSFAIISLISGIFFPIFFIAFMSIFITIFVRVIKENIRRTQNINYFASTIITNALNYRYQDVSKAKLSEYNIDDIGSLKNSLFLLFERFEKAYNSLDINTMKQISTPELFEHYNTGIQLNIKDGKKKVIDDIKRKKIIVFSMNSTPSAQTIKALITISYITYIVGKDNYLITGSKENPIEESFEVTFQKTYHHENFTKCPTCGATVSGDICEYCRNTIKDTEFKISSIRKVLE